MTEQVNTAQVKTSQQILLNAATILERDGWCQGELHSPDGKHCMIGAFDLSVFELDLSFSDGYTVRQKAMNAIKTKIGAAHIPTWNDQVARTKEEVIAKLREAAQSLETNA
jgi:hypothetical protein